MSARTLQLLADLREGMPDVPPQDRWRFGACRRFRAAALLVVEGRHDAALEILTAPEHPALNTLDTVSSAL